MTDFGAATMTSVAGEEIFWLRPDPVGRNKTFNLSGKKKKKCLQPVYDRPVETSVVLFLEAAEKSPKTQRLDRITRRYTALVSKSLCYAALTRGSP